MMTEEEARGRWCPMVRLVTSEQNGDVEVGAPAGFNKSSTSPKLKGDIVVPAEARCIGSQCMMWRWSEGEPKIEIFVNGESDADFAKRRDRILGGRKGLCGLAGKVQY